MRDVNRIDKFLKELGDLWKEVPDWRFMQLICNLQSEIGTDGFYLEENDVIKRLKEYMGK